MWFSPPQRRDRRRQQQQRQQRRRRLLLGHEEGVHKRAHGSEDAEEHVSMVSSIVFSPIVKDGPTQVIYGIDNDIYMDSVSTATTGILAPKSKGSITGSSGTVVLQGHSSRVTCVAAAATPTDKVVAAADDHLDLVVVSGSLDKTVRLWKVRKRNASPSYSSSSTSSWSPPSCTFCLEGHKAAVSCVAVSENAEWIVSASQDSTLRLWSCDTGDCQGVLRGHSAKVTSVCLLSSCAETPLSTVISASADKTIRIWMTPTRRDEILAGRMRTGTEQALWNADSEATLTSTGRNARRKPRRRFSMPSSNSFFSPSSDSAPFPSVRAFTDAASTRINTRTTSLSGSAHMSLFLATPEEPPSSDNQSSELLLSVATLEVPHFDGPITSVACSCANHDEIFVSASHRCRTAHVWRVTSGECIGLLPHSVSSEGGGGGTAGVACVAFSPDGGRIVTATTTGFIFLWNTWTTTCIARLRGDGASSRLSPQQRRMSFSSASSSSSSPSCRILSVAFSQHDEGASLAAATTGGQIRLWNGKTGERSTIFANTAAAAGNVLAFSADSTVMATGGVDRRTVSLWSHQEHSTPSAILRGHEFSVRHVVFVKASTMVATASRDTTVRLWNAATAECTAVLRGHSDVVNALAVLEPNLADENHNGNASIKKTPLVVSASDDGTLRVWNVDNKECAMMLHGHEGPVECVAAANPSQGNSLICSGGQDETIRLWNVLTGDCCFVGYGHENAVSTVTFAPTLKTEIPHADMVMIVSGSWDGTCRLWRIHQKKGTSILLLRAKDHHDDDVGEEDDLDKVNTSDREHDVQENEDDDEEEEEDDEEPPIVTCATFSPDGSTLATGWQDGRLRLYKLNLAEAVPAKCLDVLHHVHKSAITCIFFSPNATRLISGSEATIHFWDFTSKLQEDGQRFFSATGESLFISPLTLNDLVLQQSNHKERRLRAFRDEMIRHALATDFSHETAISREEKRHLGAPRQGTHRNPLWVASNHASKSAVYLRLLLQKSPGEVVVPRTTRGAADNEKCSLLMQALQDEAVDSVFEVIFTALLELLTLPHEEHEYDGSTREFVSLETFPELLVFRGNDLPTDLQSTVRHVGDLVDVEELCKVAQEYPERFLQFVRGLQVVPNYSLVQDPTARFHSLKGATYVLHGSSSRVPRCFWNEEVIRKRLRLTNAFFRTPRSYRTFFGFRRPTAPVALSPGLIPLKNIAGLVEGNKVSPFLQTVLETAERLGKFDIFENEVVQYVVEFKWYTFVEARFLTDAALFALLVIVFTVNSLLFVRYAEARAEEGTIVAGGLPLTVVTLLVLYFVVLELKQVHRALIQHGGLGVYLADGWNILDLVTLTTLVATVSVQSYALGNRIATQELQSLSNTMAAATMPTLAAQSLYYFQGAQASGALVRMNINVMKGMVVFCGMVLIFMLAFAVAFTLLFLPVRDEIDNDAIVFPNAYYRLDNTMLAAFGMLLGDINLSDIVQSSNPTVSSLLLVLFLFVTGVVLFNLLIAIMGDLYDEVQEQAVAQSTYARARLVLEYEQNRISDAKRCQFAASWYPRWIQVLSKTKTTKTLAGTMSTWEGRIKATTKPILARLQGLERVVKQSLKDRETKTDESSSTLTKMQQELRGLTHEWHEWKRETEMQQQSLEKLWKAVVEQQQQQQEDGG